MIIGVTMFKIGLAMLFFIMAAGSIDGPTGHELNNWGQCFAFMTLGLMFSIWGLLSGSADDS